MTETSQEIAEAPMASEESKEEEFADNDPEKQADADDGAAKVDTEHTTQQDDAAEKSAAELLEEDIPWIDRFKEVVVTYAPLGFVAFGMSGIIKLPCQVYSQQRAHCSHI